MRDIVVNVNEELPEYFSILRNENASPFSNDDFHFTDSRLNGLMLDPHGLQIDKGCKTFHVCHPCNGYLPWSLMPRFAFANKLYRGHLPEEF
jgi:hypothetical protein